MSAIYGLSLEATFNFCARVVVYCFVIFMTLEDESALVNIVVWPSLWEKQRILAQKSNLLGIHGVLQKDGRAISILARKFWPIKLDNFEFYSPARNFH